LFASLAYLHQPDRLKQYYYQDLGNSDAVAIFHRMVQVIVDPISIVLPSSFAEPSIVLQRWRDFHSSYLASVITTMQFTTSRRWSSNYLPLVTVVICHHNRGLHLIETIRSVLMQRISCDLIASPDCQPLSLRLELIIVDDGSNDQRALQILDAISGEISSNHLLPGTECRMVSGIGYIDETDVEGQRSSISNEDTVNFLKSRWKGGLVSNSPFQLQLDSMIKLS
jgi:hypothetical protein